MNSDASFIGNAEEVTNVLGFWPRLQGARVADLNVSYRQGTVIMGLDLSLAPEFTQFAALGWRVLVLSWEGLAFLSISDAGNSKQEGVSRTIVEVVWETVGDHVLSTFQADGASFQGQIAARQVEVSFFGSGY